MMTQTTHSQKTAGAMRRVLAVVAEQAARARDMAAQFAKQGEEVDAIWYASSQRLLAEAGQTRFEAVILFPSPDVSATDADEMALRSGLRNTPVYRVG